MKIKSLVCLAIVLFAASFAGASIIEVGTGSNTVGVEIEWKDGFLAEFEVSFDTPSITGWEVVDIIEAETTLVTARIDYGTPEDPYVFLDGLTFDGHSNIGWDGGEDWWHYWIEDAAGNWESPYFGLPERVLEPGDRDGWRYGSALAPGVPEPATMLLLAVGGMLVRKKRS
jgi:hypothetical protein